MSNELSQWQAISRRLQAEGYRVAEHEVWTSADRLKQQPPDAWAIELIRGEEYTEHRAATRGEAWEGIARMFPAPAEEQFCPCCGAGVAYQGEHEAGDCIWNLKQQLNELAKENTYIYGLLKKESNE